MNMKVVLTFFALFCSLIAYSQGNVSVKGKVTEKETGQPAIGVSIMVKGTTNGTMTTLDGDYELSNVPGDAILVISSIGKGTQEIPVAGRTQVNVVVADDAQLLEQVVVVGYGSAKAKDLTAPITVVKAEAITNRMTASPMQALQGKVAGMQIVNSGAPGSNPTVRIRGVGTLDSDRGGPLYVVDGMFYDNIAFLNNNDIEDITILKDASSSSIYGVRASNGVIIITTKKGTINAKPVITYSGSAGVQVVAQRVKMANAAQYATMMLERRESGDSIIIRNSINRFGGEGLSPAASTDWYRELLRPAMIQNHDVGIAGGSEKTSYSLGMNYLSQDGVMDADNNYSRFNIRSRGDYQAYSWLKLGASVVISNIKQTVTDASVWRSAFVAPPILPVYDEANTVAFPVRFTSLQSIGLPQSMNNPVAQAYYKDQLDRTFQVLPSFYAEFTFIPSKLNFKTAYAQNVNFRQSRDFMPAYLVSASQQRANSELRKTNDFYSDYIWDNFLTYRDQINKHSFSGMLGHSLRNESFRQMDGRARNVPAGLEEYMYLSQGTERTRTITDDGTTYLGVSFFGRATYDYDGRYLVSATLRADGSSKYQEKWGYFPSIGTAWVMTQEEFFKNQRVFDFLKIRAGWGLLGNDKVQSSDGFASITQDQGTSGIFDGVSIPGFTSGIRRYAWLKWEVTSELNVGTDFALLNNRLRGELDYFRRQTNDAVFSAPVPLTSRTILGNNGTILNTGIEVTLNWSDIIGKEFRYNVGGNFTYLKNKIKDLNGLSHILGGSEEFRAISQVGGTHNAFYGWRVLGVYQNQAQIDADPVAAANNLANITNPGSIIEPGDFIYEDVDGNHEIGPEDRQVLGSYLPKVTIGANIGFEYRNFDFNMIIQGQFGNKIANQKRGIRYWDGSMNYDDDMVTNRWTGDGSTNKYPSARASSREWNVQRFNSFLVENGSSVTIQNVQVGYTFQNIGPKDKGARLRLSLVAERPFSFFSYNGFTTDVPNGFDLQVYPLASIYSIGIKLIY